MYVPVAVVLESKPQFDLKQRRRTEKAHVFLPRDSYYLPSCPLQKISLLVTSPTV